MTKTKTNIKTTKKNNNKSQNFIDGFFTLLTNTVNAIGIPGTIVVYSIYYIEKHTSDLQKEELFNNYVLFNNAGSQRVNIALIGFFMVLIIAQNYFFRRIRKIDREEIRRLAQYKTDYQVHAIQKDLHHSEK